jgi:hypothetical protein
MQRFTISSAILMGGGRSYHSNRQLSEWRCLQLVEMADRTTAARSLVLFASQSVDRLESVTVAKLNRRVGLVRAELLKEGPAIV